MAKKYFIGFVKIMYNVSFKSLIMPVTQEKFFHVASCVGEKNFVKSPWTVAESVLNRSAGTTNVSDCTFCAITDGLKVLMMHLCATNPLNYNFGKIADFITQNLKNMNKENGLQALVLGAQKSADGRSSKQFDNFIKFLETNDIKTSYLKYGKGAHHVVYISNQDTFFVFGKEITKAIQNGKSSKEIIYSQFEDVKLAECDEII